jgi:hypothetical protein
MKTIDLRKAELQPVAGDDIKTLQALLNLFLTAGDVGEDGSPIAPLILDGTAGANTKQRCSPSKRRPISPRTPSRAS